MVIQTAGQFHPSHFHKKKEETFYILSGELDTEIDGIKRKITAGEQVLIQPGVWHSFSTDKGVIFEELSTTHYDNDSTSRQKYKPNHNFAPEYKVLKTPYLLDSISNHTTFV